MGGWEGVGVGRGGWGEEGLVGGIWDCWSIETQFYGTHISKLGIVNDASHK